MHKMHKKQKKQKMSRDRRKDSFRVLGKCAMNQILMTILYKCTLFSIRLGSWDTWMPGRSRGTPNTQHPVVTKLRMNSALFQCLFELAPLASELIVQICELSEEAIVGFDLPMPSHFG